LSKKEKRLLWRFPNIADEKMGGEREKGRHLAFIRIPMVRQ
jgi:hypothetical protein